MADDKKIFKPLDLNESIQGWLIHAHKGRDRHDLSARYFERKNNWLGIPAIILSATTGTTIFASIASQENMEVWVKLVIGSLSICTAVLASLQTFHNHRERAEKHRITGVKYKEVIRTIEKATLSHTFSQQEVDEVFSRLNQIEENAPVVPDAIINKINKQYQQVSFIDKASNLYNT